MLGKQIKDYVQVFVFYSGHLEQAKILSVDTNHDIDVTRIAIAPSALLDTAKAKVEELTTALTEAQAREARLREAIKKLPRFNFLLNSSGGVQRWQNQSGDWIEQHEVIMLFEALANESPATALQERLKNES